MAPVAATAPTVTPRQLTPGHASRSKSGALLVPWSFSELMDRQPSVSDREVNGAMKTLQSVRSYFQKLGVSSAEGNSAGLPVVFEPKFPNAAFAQTKDGRDVLIIGNDPDTGTSFARANDVLAHEYSHRLLNNLVGLHGHGESGAVNESLADTFAAAIDRDDWTIGEDVTPGGLRSMDNPERAQDAIPVGRGRHLRQPGHMNDYLELPEHPKFDMGGVHINVGIPNKAAAAIGKSVGRDTMAQIYIDAARRLPGEHSTIADTAQATLGAAVSRFGNRSEQAQAVRQAWEGVGISL